LNVAGDVQAAFGCQFLSAFRDDANNLRLEAGGDVHHLGRVGHFKVETRFDGLTKFPDVAILDVAAVFAEMRGDAVGAGGFADESCLDGIRFAAIASGVARLAQGRDVINVHAQLQHS
jgi:hypothetical protein